jgi:serine/threonine protein kinase
MNNEHQACIADFSLSSILGELGFTMKLVAETCQWMVYELVELSDEEEESVPQVTTASDIWAFGITILEV